MPVEKNHHYDDIIDLPHHVSAIHPPMPLADRAAQFSAFAALSGFDAAIAETARSTDERIELGENAINELDAKLGILTGAITIHPEITVTHFRADEKKEGGAYVSTTGAVKKIDEVEHSVVLMDGQRILIEDIYDLKGELFHCFESADD